MTRLQTTQSTQKQAAESLMAKVSHLMQHPHYPRPLELLVQVDQLLEILPLATADFDLARARVRNARRYFSAGEIGAASYELRLLSGLLRAI